MTVHPGRISLVIPSYNQARWLGECIESVLAQEDADLEVMVYDGGSTDGSRDVIEHYADRLAFWVSETDRGQSHALNKGFSRATGEWLGWLNSDDMLLPGALTSLRSAMEEQPDASWFTGGGRYIDEDGNPIREYPSPERRLSARDLSPWTRSWFGQPGTFFKRDLYEVAGGRVREDLRHAMDLDLWLRMGAHEDLHPIDHPLGAYRLQGGSKTVAERPDMEVEVVRVLIEELGLESGLSRVAILAEDRFEIEARYRALAENLRSPTGWFRLARKRLRKMWGSNQPAPVEGER